MKKTTINFDMDGCLAGLYDVPNWLEYLLNEDTTPYAIAKPLLRFASLAKRLNNLQKQGIKIAIISWGSKEATANFDARIVEAKTAWLKKHLPSVNWDRITIVPYGTPKQNYCETPLDILFDDEAKNRDNWTGRAYDVQNIMEILREI